MNRECGSCTMCCQGDFYNNVYGNVVKFNKPCVFSIKNEGCSIHKTKPDNCKNFKCAWLKGLFEDDMRPDKSKIVGLLEDNCVDNLHMVNYVKLIEVDENNMLDQVNEWCNDHDINTTVESYQDHRLSMTIIDS